MKIGFDARLINETGIGRYIQNLLKNLAVADQKNEYVIFLPSGLPVNSWKIPKKWTTQTVNVRWHTLREQIVMPFEFYKHSLDLLHVPYFNIPIFYSRPYIVTIHDLIVHHFDTGKASTLPLPLYKLRRLGYELIQSLGLKRATRIIAVSRNTKSELIEHYHVPDSKIDVIYEGIDENIITNNDEKVLYRDSYFLYVGNAYPHKNLQTLIHAFRILNRRIYKSITHKKILLVLVGKEDYFYKRMKLENEFPEKDSIIFHGNANDRTLANLYRNALALVMPSVMEGFGFPPLEALANGTPVIVSDIPVFHEILNDFPLYFNVNNPDDLADKMFSIAENRVQYVNRLPEPAKIKNKYRWDQATLATLRCYERSRL